MSTYIISDIHGHLDLFKNLLGKKEIKRHLTNC